MELSFKDIDWRSLLLKRYKGLKLDEKDTMVIFMTDQVTAMDSSIPVTAEVLSQYMVATKEEIDESLEKLLDKNLIEIDPSNGSITLKPLFTRLFNDIKKDLLIASDPKVQRKMDECYEFFQKQLGRVLSPMDVQKINSWIGQGASLALLQEALFNVQSKTKIVTFRKLDNEVLRLLKESDIKKEGYTLRDKKHPDNKLPNVMSKDWQKND